jgi:ribosomal protein L29
MTDLRDMSDDELDDHRKDVLKEIDRREKLETLPEEIGKLRDEYEKAGGDLDDLDDKGDDEE